MKKSLRTRISNRIIGSDYSAQEPRISAFLSQEPKLLNAFIEGKDVYAMIYSGAVGCKYEDALEFYVPGTEVDMGDKKVIAGNGSERDEKIENNQFKIKYYELLNTKNGEKSADELNINDSIICDSGEVKITNKVKDNDIITFTLDSSANTVNIKSPAKIMNMTGKKNRTKGKILNLATSYGMGGKGAADMLGMTVEEGQKLLDDFFANFDHVRDTIAASKEFLKKNGYVEDFYGRRRHLPDIDLPLYTAFYKDSKKNDELSFNPIIFCEDKEAVDSKLQSYINAAYKTTRKKDLDVLIAKAEKEGILLRCNSSKISQAERQCYNARIQGSAATLTKLAMIAISNDPIMKQCHAELIITVHDEVLIECPDYYKDIIGKRLPELMIGAAKPYMNVPMKCDVGITKRWYADVMAAELHKEFRTFKEKMSEEEALEALYKEHEDLPAEAIKTTVLTGAEEIEF